LYTSQVFSGELSSYLLKPINSQFLLMTQTNSYSHVFRFFIAIAVFVKSFVNLQLHPSLWQWLFFSLYIVVSFCFVYFLWFIFSTLSFWVDKLDNINEIIPAARRIWQVPEDVYRGPISWLIVVLVPLGLVSAIPTRILLGNFNLWSCAYFLAFTIFVIFFSKWFFHYSIKKYTGIAN